MHTLASEDITGFMQETGFDLPAAAAVLLHRDLSDSNSTAIRELKRVVEEYKAEIAQMNYCHVGKLCELEKKAHTFEKSLLISLHIGHCAKIAILAPKGWNPMKFAHSDPLKSLDRKFPGVQAN